MAAYTQSNRLGKRQSVMKQIFEAQNITEAHMIQNMLIQANIHSHLQGEQLKNSIEGLQTNAIKVIIEDHDYLKAIAIIRDWEDKQPKQKKEKTTKINPTLSLFQIFIGFILGTLLTMYLFMSPISEQGIDYNMDGVIDHVNILNGSRLKSSSIDRNFDGTADLKHNFNYQGVIKFSEADEDFNGTFETNMTYKSDTTGDGYPDYQIQFEHGVIKQAMRVDPQSKLPIHIQTYDKFKVIDTKHK